MADASVSLRWDGELRFHAAGEQGAEFVVDGDKRAGPSPVELLLLSLAACTAADIVDIAGKMRVSLGGLAVEAEGDRVAEPPRRYTHVRLRFVVQGVTLEHEPKLRRALDLSLEKYCSVLHTLRPELNVRAEIVLDE